jgi:SAM-dependent methyltransferase
MTKTKSLTLSSTLLASLFSMSMSYVPVYADEQTERIFSYIYEQEIWEERAYGCGNRNRDEAVKNSAPYCKFIEDFLRDNQIQSVVDAGCGDWTLLQPINWRAVRYLGVDIVKPVIEKNQTQFASPTCSFLHADITEADLPSADLLICKDVLHHLTDNQVAALFKQFPKFKFCLVVTNTDPTTHTSQNKTIVCGGCRTLDITKAPFNMKAVKIFHYQAGDVVKQVALVANPDHSPQLPAKSKSFVFNSIHPYQGFFSVFLTVLNYVDLYDKQGLAGLQVDFRDTGLYYEAAFGSNSWTYFFEPLTLGSVEGVDCEYHSIYEPGFVGYITEFGISRQRLAELVKKYIRIKPAIQQEVDRLVADQFQDKFVIGVHYRGTDKTCPSSEALPVSYEDVSKAVTDVVNQHQLQDYRVFVATDEERFLHYMQEAFPGKIIFQDCLRSSTDAPVHFHNPKNTSPYMRGKEAVLDCLLLSRCHTLIRTSSYLSFSSCLFNPDLPVIVLNQRTKGFN